MHYRGVPALRLVTASEHLHRGDGDTGARASQRSSGAREQDSYGGACRGAPRTNPPTGCADSRVVQGVISKRDPVLRKPPATPSYRRCTAVRCYRWTMKARIAGAAKEPPPNQRQMEHYHLATKKMPLAEYLVFTAIGATVEHQDCPLGNSRSNEIPGCSVP